MCLYDCSYVRLRQVHCTWLMLFTGTQLTAFRYRLPRPSNVGVNLVGTGSADLHFTRIESGMSIVL